ncbi:type II restriction endonuclease [Amaricoccus tamworthensis]|uniref:type II restriction endonuclease n=1 Tax=Amaricoccus tamworthensis TaxID=57002 RepID=UPI003C7DAA0B
MKQGSLRQYFDGIACKSLTSVDTVQGKSNQHEVGGRNAFNTLLGTDANRMRKENNGIPTRYVRITDDAEDSLTVDSDVTWYDSRWKDPKRGPEWRLYYPTNEVTRVMREGDLFLLAKKPDGTLLIVVAPNGSTVEQQLQWLFGVEATHSIETLFGDDLETGPLDHQVRGILEDLGIEVLPEDSGWLDRMVETFHGAFPSTARFSDFARATLPEMDAKADPDGALLAWFEREDVLFRELEQHVVSQRIREGFQSGNRTDVASFVRFSLSVNNRRKSRAGYAFAHHVREVFLRCGIAFEAEVVTEMKKRLDFMLPSGSLYHREDVARERLIALGVKTTCKDRWRQVLSEAEHIPQKYLLTLETRISFSQLQEMASDGLRLVIPKARHWDFGGMAPGTEPMSVAEFIEMARERQTEFGILPGQMAFEVF